MIQLTYRQAFALAVALFVVAALVCAPVAAVAGPILRGWTYSAQAPANPQPGDGWLPTNHQNLRYWSGTHWEPVGGRWYKVASHTQDDWNGFSGPTNPAIPNPLHPEPGMPQALGFENWQALCDDIRSLDGVISDVGLWYERTPNPYVKNPKTTYFDVHPAGLVPVGQPSSVSSTEWFYFTWDMLRERVVHNKAYVRCQPDPDYPVMLLDYGIDSPWDITFALYVKI